MSPSKQVKRSNDKVFGVGDPGAKHTRFTLSNTQKGTLAVQTPMASLESDPIISLLYRECTSRNCAPEFHVFLTKYGVDNWLGYLTISHNNNDWHFTFDGTLKSEVAVKTLLSQKALDWFYGITPNPGITTVSDDPQKSSSQNLPASTSRNKPDNIASDIDMDFEMEDSDSYEPPEA